MMANRMMRVTSAKKRSSARYSDAEQARLWIIKPHRADHGFAHFAVERIKAGDALKRLDIPSQTCHQTAKTDHVVK
jgi:hypothetical protein